VLTRRFGMQFQFDIPEGWKEFRESGRYVVQGPGPGLQELIFQSYVLQGEGSAQQQEQLLAGLAENALSALRNALDGGLLAIKRPLGPDASLPVQPAWSTMAQAVDDGTLFCGAVFRGSGAILLLTWEASARPGNLELYASVVNSVRCVATVGRA
jgi:hypothetical protein